MQLVNKINYQNVTLATTVHKKWNILYLQKISCICHLKYTFKNHINEQLLHTVCFMSHVMKPGCGIRKKPRQ